MFCALLSLTTSCGFGSSDDNSQNDTSYTETKADTAVTEVDENTAQVTETSEAAASDTTITETAKPETKAPETTAPETKAPETTAPETTAPETKAPETTAPETKAPETKAPETKAPETKAPETKAPETKAPEVKVPETNAPVTKAPETQASAATQTLSESAIFSSAAITGLKIPSAPGTNTKTSDIAILDYSNAAEGYVMLKYSGQTDKKYVFRITDPNGIYYDYYLLSTSSGTYQTFPLSEGNGTYSAVLYESRSGTKYASVFSAQIDAAIKDDYTAFLYPNYYVNYSGSYKAIKLAAYITKGMTKSLDKISAVYNYVIDNIKYDYDLSSKITSTSTIYVPDLEAVIVNKKGICFDYASLMSAMLRSLGIPSKLVIGYAGQTYHAWINVYTTETGWINAIISFDGKTWKLMDPTYASTSNEDSTIMKYIADTSNYSAKYIY